MANQSVPVLDLLHPDFISDPVPMIDRMLREQPIAFDPRMGGWLIGRYRDIMALHRDPRLSCQRTHLVTATLPTDLHDMIEPFLVWARQGIAMSDPPRHTRLRRLASHAFQPGHLARLESWIQSVVDELIDGVIDAGEMELVSDFACPLPQRVISQMVGISTADRDKFIAWTSAPLNVITSGSNSADTIQQALDAVAELKDYFGALIPQRRKRLVEGEILSDLIAASEQQDRLTTEEITVVAADIMSGGYHTTTHLISSLMLQLLRHPDQLALVRKDPDLAASAVEEVMRYEPSITFNTRAVTEPIEYEGARFEPGQLLYLITCAANRDPERFPEPHRFDVTRKDNKHLTFGLGAHFCLGAPLARMEARIALRRLLERLPDLHLPEQPIERLPYMAMRPLARLVVRW
jgi:pimeloyl-[acyl-carrier protein] synthase